MKRPAPLIYSVAIAPSDKPAVGRLVASAFGEAAAISEFENIESALSTPPEKDCLVLLGNPSEATLAAASEAKDGFGLSQWQVVAIGSEQASSCAPTIDPSELGSRAASALLRFAMRSHEERRRLEEARGDMLSIATRICHDLRSPLGVLQASIHLLSQAELAAHVPRSEIAQPALDSLRKQSRLVSLVSVFADATGGSENERARVDMASAFAMGHDRCKQALEAKGARVEARGDWLDSFGVASWVELMWELAITSALDRHDRGNAFEAGCRENGPDELECYIRFEQISSDEPARPMQILPFNLVHVDRNSRDIGLPIAQRFAHLQGGRSGTRATAHGFAEFFFALPRAREQAAEASGASDRFA